MFKLKQSLCIGTAAFFGMLPAVRLLTGQQPVKVAQLDKQSPLGRVTLTLSHGALTPALVTVKPGQHEILVRNGIFTVPIHLDVTGKGLAAREGSSVDVDHVHSSFGHGLFLFTAGTYEVTVREFPKYKATIQVIP